MTSFQVYTDILGLLSFLFDSIHHFQDNLLESFAMQTCKSNLIRMIPLQLLRHSDQVAMLDDKQQILGCLGSGWWRGGHVENGSAA